MCKLVKWMGKHSLTCKAAGVLLGGYSESVVSRWKRGETKVPKAAIRLMDFVPSKGGEH